MLEKEKLRKTDVFSGVIIVLFGAAVMIMGFQMPMRDSWGGVQNVWFVSPALFPLFVGFMIMLLGALLSMAGLKAVGRKALKDTIDRLLSKHLVQQLRVESFIRFYAISVLFFTFIFLNIPRIDFFLCSVLFLFAFITMFYFDDDTLLFKLFRFYLAGAIGLFLYFAIGLDVLLSRTSTFTTDILAMVFTLAYCLYAWKLIRGQAALRRKYRISLIISFVAPFSIGLFFKYFLLVPMPYEGLIVTILDYIRFFKF